MNGSRWRAAMAGLILLSGTPARAQFPFPLPPLPFPLPGAGAATGRAPFNLPFIAPPLAEVPENSRSRTAITESHGGALDAPQAALVSSAMAKVSIATRPVAPPSGFRVTFLNSPVVNAMAIGDGNIFVTRQMLALTSSEDELIGILGHEAGHVMARHSSIGALPEQVKSGGTSLLGLVSPDLAAVVGLGGTLAVRFFDRAKEHQSDVIGTKVLADMGLDPMAMHRAIALLEADDRVDRLVHGRPKVGVLDDFLRTHPVSTQRLQLIATAAAMAPRAAPQPNAIMAKADYVRALDGLMFDDGPNEGVVDGARFEHGPMGLALEAPSGFELRNTPNALIINGPKDANAVLAAKPDAKDLPATFRAIWTEEIGKLAPAPSPATRTIAGLSALEGHAQVKGKSGSVDVVLTLVDWPDAGMLTILSVDPAGAAAPALAQLRSSIRRLSAADSAAVPVRRVKVVEASAKSSIAGLGARMAYRDHGEARFRALNGLPSTGGKLGSGPVKIIVWSNGRGLF